MTSAIFSRFPRSSRTVSRRPVRIAAAAAGLVGVLTLTACGGDGDSSDGSSSGSGASATATADTGGGSGGTTATSDELQGSWLATTGGKAVALVVNGRQAGLFSTGGTVCSGTAGKESGARTIRLTCTDGSKDRATGTVDSVNKTSLTITWSGGLGPETYTKSEGGTLPSGLPTATLGS
ncbi:hypothetical protein [Streptomyces sp. H51]|uniref:hypothetical protein n=1 Tax=Streptomyces sp. H51 TaxID=3111770 RepID=UPI002D7A03CA|nr:hypothetical protein [Streptomyces sp. H51]